MVTLVVDDDSVSRLVCEHILRSGGHDVVVHESAEDAIAALREQTITFDAIVCDYHMPGANGLDLLETISADPSLSGTPFVLLTGVDELDDLDDPRVHDTDGYLTKPVKSSELLDLLNKLVG